MTQLEAIKDVKIKKEFDTSIPEPVIDENNEIIFEDEEKVVVSKSGNCPVSEGGAYKENCLTRILEKKLGYCVFPVYRLDRETSGIIVFAKQNGDVRRLKAEIKEKTYSAICENAFENDKYGIDIEINELIGETKGEHIMWKKCVDKIDGNFALTTIKPIKEIVFRDSKEVVHNFSLVEVRPQTNRQHQIRVHLSYIGHPIIGDKWYGKSDKLFKDHLDKKVDTDALILRQALHLGKIKIGEIVHEKDMPEDMKKLIV